MVVAYHVWLGRVSGGIDVFLLISAFLMSGGLVRRLERGERVSLVRHWLHVFQRLVPAAVVVLVATLGLSAVVLPATRWADLLEEGVACLGYAQNWLLAHRAVDYYAADQSVASPLQHFWSLSLQGQIFLLWPLLIVGLGWVARRSGVALRPLVATLFSAVFVASLVYSVHTTAQRQSFAYFDGAARLWEFAFGTLLALGLARLTLRRAVAVPLGWLGLVGMLSCGLVLQVTRSFPGYLALWPLLSAAAIIAAGRTGHPLGVDRLLSTRLLAGVGGYAYALYLVHWPVLVLWLAVSGRAGAGLVDGLGVVVVSFGLAVALSRFVEMPLRRRHWPEHAPWRSALLLACIVGTALALCGAGFWQLHREAARAQTVATGGFDARHPGARVVELSGPVGQLPVDERLPAVTALRGEFAALEAPCSGDWAAPREMDCRMYEPTAPARRTLVVVGDSHGEQWLASLLPLARDNDWRLVSLLKGACSFGAAQTRSGDCAAFNREAMRYLTTHRPDDVVTVATAAHPTTSAERLVVGYESAVRTLTEQGIRVIGIRDNPRFRGGVVACVLREGDASPRCRAPAATKLAPVNPAAPLAAIDGLTLIDLTDRICPAGECVPSVGNVWVYLDDNHLTKTYAATLAPVLAQRLREGGGWPG
jgi:peptidoglycan/LPS O-acetylase OafA/YrhL